ncbi:cytochrome P450 CYP749A22-like isoform X2 [Tripterygium wilfordii]|uniref:cytochrome P450 CYP749A22-like isoform X2 n=1 Tax=Tripterygium wilfordii TaxID=458696 RepID=UPI0018F80A0F|nr:cytochrome P450 CYP749A22-like isoform X2 [Tripterygium wilfordii]
MAAGIATLFLDSICLYLLFVLVKFLYKVWWTPIWTQKVMAKQGIRGPRYRFLHGNMKEVMQMKKEAMAITMGLSNDIIQKVQPQFHRWINTYGKNFLFWQGPKAQVFVSEGELMKEILNNKEKTYPKQELAPYAQKLIGNSLVSFEGEIWSKMRKLANHAFHGESLKNLTPEMVASSEMMLERWKKHEGKEIEVFEEFKQLTSEVISRTAFGSSYVEGKDIFEKLRKVLMIAHRPPPSKFSFSIFRGNGGENEMQKLVSEMRNEILEMIRKREKKVKSGEAESYGKDFLGLLLQSCHDPDESQRITVENVIDECKGMYVAGQETTTNLLSWTIMLLAIHTDWQEEARKEVQDIFGQQIPNPDGISKLKIMGMIINETLRLYPPAMGVIRKVNREVQLGKYRLPSNTNFYLPILKLHHDPKTWGEDAHLFKPERFAEGVAKATGNDVSAFCPFGIGPRTCVGSNFAITEVKIALSMILQRYSFTLSPAYVHSPVQVLLLRPQHGVQIILEPLNR